MLELKNVCKTFHAGTPDEKKALIDISLKIEDGDFVSIIGANGAGKSTLFNAICGSFVLDSGSIYLGGKNVTMVPEHQRARQIGRLFQDPSSPGFPTQIKRHSGTGSVCWAWDWRTGCASRWDCCPAVSARR